MRNYVGYSLIFCTVMHLLVYFLAHGWHNLRSCIRRRKVAYALKRAKKERKLKKSEYTSVIRSFFAKRLKWIDQSIKENDHEAEISDISDISSESESGASSDSAEKS